MLPEIRRILYATDLSDNARFAFSYAMLMAVKFDAKIDMLHVVEYPSPSGLGFVIDYVGEERWQESQKEKMAAYQTKMKQRLQAFCAEQSEVEECPFVVDQCMIKAGNSAEVIIETAKKGDYDMVIMGTHGHGMVKGAVMGNTARRVIRRCRVPVTVIRLPEGE